jgi:hypothetical protein
MVIIMKIENQKIRVVVGWNNPKYNVKGLADGWEADGYNVIRVAADVDLPECSGTFHYHLLEEMIKMFPYDTGMNSKRPGYRNMTQYQIKMSRIATAPALSFPMYYLFEKIEKEHGPIYDIVVCQCDLILDMKNVSLSWDWYYYFTEGYKPLLPLNDSPKGVFYGYVGGNETLLRSFPYEYHRWKFCKLVPYGMDKMAIPPVIPAWEIRDFDVGFKGLVHFSQHSMDTALRNVYDERRYYLNWIQSYMESAQYIDDLIDTVLASKQYTWATFWDFVSYIDSFKIPIFKFESHNSFEAYVPFMLNTKVAINIQGGDAYGWLNQRMYEALGFKCLLLQNFFPKLNEFGFIDGDTCLTFSSEVELKQKLLWIFTHWTEAEAIAERGHQLFLKTKCSWQDRAREMDQIIHAPLDESAMKFQTLIDQYQNEINGYANGTTYTSKVDYTNYSSGKFYDISPHNTT